MIEERTKELIHAAMDGELSGAEMAELEERLEESGEARRYQAGMRELDSFLGQLPPEVMPDGMHEKLTRAVTLPDRLAARPQAAGWPGFLRYGFAAAAGLLLAVGIYRFGWEATAPGDLDQMVGTMAPGNVVELDSFSFVSDSVGSSATLERRAGSLVLNVAIDSDEAVEIAIDFSGTALDFEVLAKTDNDLESFEYTSQAIRVRSRGRQKFAVLLHPDGTEPDRDGAISLEYSSDGRLIQQGTLVPRW